MHEALYAQMRDLEDRHWWFLGRRRIIQSIITRLDLDPGTSILDAGCGTGGNLAMLKQFGEVVAAEYDAAAAAIARERGVAPIVRASLPHAMPFEKERFDLITLLDVLEHIEDDQGSLHALRDLLRPGGHMLITVPAFPFLWGAHDTEHHHKRRYRAPQLRQQLELSGLRVEWLSYYNSWLFPLVAAVRLFHQLVPPTAVGGELTLPPAPLNDLLAILFASERHWLGRLSAPFGISLIALVRKP